MITFGSMIGQNQVRNSKSSRFAMSMLILLGLLAFSGSASPIMDSRKPANRETIAQRKIIAKRSISFHHARQHIIATDFYREIGFVSLANSILQVDRLSHITLQIRKKEKPNPVKISQSLQLHAPRSADILVNLS